MTFEQDPAREEQELMNTWQNALPAERMDAAQIAEATARRMKRFDRTIWWRNFREYAAGGIMLAYFSWRLFDDAQRLISAAGIIAVGFVMGYLWWNHRSAMPLDAAADGASYRAALLDRYDRQIHLLSRAKYWYVLPLYLWMLLSIILSVPSEKMGRQIGAGAVVTLFSIFVAWLNEGYGVKKLHAQRRQAESLFEEGEG